jgi:hypothetical protein
MDTTIRKTTNGVGFRPRSVIRQGKAYNDDRLPADGGHQDRLNYMLVEKKEEVVYLSTNPFLWFVNVETAMQAVLGMWIKTANEGIQHHGLVTGFWLDPYRNQWVVLVTHTTPDKGVHVSTLDEFSLGRALALVAQPGSVEHQKMILETARVNEGQPYLVFNKNCEHFCSHCYTHQAQSSQLQTDVLVGGLLTFLVVAVAKSRRHR